MKFSALLTITTLLATTTAKEKISLQWAICNPNPQDVLPQLGLSANTPPYKENPITYYDAQPPRHIAHGLMFRTKTNKGHPLSTVKAPLPGDVEAPGFVECAWASYGENPATYTCEKRCPRDGDGDEDEEDYEAEGGLWCPEQMEFVKSVAPDPVEWSALAPYGPFANAKWKVKVDGVKAKFDDVVVPEHGLHLMEIETKVKASKAEKARVAITEYLVKQGVELCELQEGKTKRLFRAMGYTDTEEEDKVEL
ncbi:hypothetical protein P168DRAFT_288093 [Aspergillus campestris IBT 28561]|uniref:CYTH domain-containing protein n=1 Tax=Aspergillus campestris (strain IBT 28561) TaxID=1392248 RepID=A0A2I1DCR1_ASPC2|nr:uncharacterized protein P168DRAFT_288093 [Aspergillus campestris IBT 28561]PKY07645.1 hypothetical protein P168DRAFT_288093 [Aspergillus campestris IBT 28561]